ncbi:ABC transporter transmembrane domain-containing protein [Fodinicurvata sp. EGI_FJ10296]|uniref:ABC transporter transmembrane domain-containing protein n=1 Tax=Fodinicurvata sp. EGI_FJ10296 TaxID=3231908 RepID=UPI0034536733
MTDPTAQSRPFDAIRRLGPYLAPHKGRLAVAGAALTITAMTLLGMGIGIRIMVDRGFADGAPDFLNRAIAILVAVIVVMAGTTYLRLKLVSWIGETVVAGLRRDAYDSVIVLDPDYFETMRSGDVVARLTADTGILQSLVGGTLPVFLRNSLTLAGGAVLLVMTSPWLAALTALVVPVALVPMIVIGRRVRRLSGITQERIADLGARIDETVHGVATVQAFGQEKRESQRFAEQTADALAAAMKQADMRAALSASVITLVFGAIVIVLWVGGHQVISGDLTPGALTAFIFYSVLVAGAAGGMSEVMGELQRAAGATDRLFELINARPVVAAPDLPTPLPLPSRGALAFDGVSFAYASRPGSAVLADIDLVVEPGTTVALVGPSGAGKSTVFHLALRFRDPLAGRILLDGVDLRDADPGAVRGRMALVPQDPVLFSGTVAENIRYGRPTASDDEMEAAAEAANASGFIRDLGDGYDSVVGERGVRLSGGQKQRIAIARALLRDPALLLLDEATSALDAESEHYVQAALDRLMAGRTTLVIAHRLATVREADRIVVLDRGRIVDIGRHEELLERGGLYARLAALQFNAVDPDSVLSKPLRDRTNGDGVGSRVRAAGAGTESRRG